MNLAFQKDDHWVMEQPAIPFLSDQTHSVPV